MLGFHPHFVAMFHRHHSPSCGANDSPLILPLMIGLDCELSASYIQILEIAATHRDVISRFANMASELDTMFVDSALNCMSSVGS